MNKDCIKIDDMHFVERHINPVHGTVKARLVGSSAASKISLTLPNSAKVVDVLTHLEKKEVEVYVVRKGSNMANLGMALIKASFEQGFSGAEDYDRYADEVRDIVGIRILTKVDPEPEFIEPLESDTMCMRLDGVVVCDCKDLFAYVRPAGVVLFEAKSLGDTCENGMVYAVDNCNTDYFKRRQFGLRSYNALYVRPATKDQYIEYLKLKYEFLKSLENETDKNK